MKIQTRKVTVIAVAAMLLATTAMSTSALANSAFAYKNQATSQADACGNDFIPTNIGCENTGSEIQGDENSVALAAEQTFPEVERERDREKDHKGPFPPSTVCFDTQHLGLLTQLEGYLASGVLFHEETIHNIAELCEVLVAASMTMTPVTVDEMYDLLSDALPGNSDLRPIADVIASLLQAELLEIESRYQINSEVTNTEYKTDDAENAKNIVRQETQTAAEQVASDIRLELDNPTPPDDDGGFATSQEAISSAKWRCVTVWFTIIPVWTVCDIVKEEE